MSNRNLKIQQLRNSRILKEFKEIYKNPADIDNDIFKINDGIYVHINDENINNVLILIIGPNETPYSYGNYFLVNKYSRNLDSFHLFNGLPSLNISSSESRKKPISSKIEIKSCLVL